MSHLSLYRKYRSQTFSDLVGQEHVVKTLVNAVASGKIAHAYLFTGPRGTGKTSTARLLAKCLCADNGPTATPDPESEISKLIAQGSCVDVVEMDAASESGVDDIRQAIVEAVDYAPMMCLYKVFIIDEVHDLSAKAFDALLKTIEEPPPHVVFILATTEYNKVPATIRSRCQKYEFHRGSLRDLVSRLEYVSKSEGAEAEPAALVAIARMADGGFRDALTLLEQVLLTSSGKITLADVHDQLGLVSDEAIDKLLLSISEGEVQGILEVLEEVAQRGRDPRAILDTMLYRLADLTRAIYQVEVGASGDATREAALHEVAARIGKDQILRIRNASANAYKDIRDITLPRLWLESILIGLATTRATEPARVERQQPAKAQVQAARPVPAPPQKPDKAAEAELASAPTEQVASETVVVSAVGTADEQLWQRMLQNLVAPAHKLKLKESRLISRVGDTLTIELPRAMEVDWFEEKPVRKHYLVTLLNELEPAKWEIRFQGGEKSNEGPRFQAVELPAEGQALYDKVVAVFKS